MSLLPREELRYLLALSRKCRSSVQRRDRTVLVGVEEIVYASAAHGYCHVKLAEERVLVNFRSPNSRDASPPTSSVPTADAS